MACFDRRIINLLIKSIAMALIQMGIFNLDLDREEVIQYLQIQYEGTVTEFGEDDGDDGDSSDFLNAIELVEKSGFMSTCSGFQKLLLAVIYVHTMFHNNDQ